MRLVKDSGQPMRLLEKRSEIIAALLADNVLVRKLKLFKYYVYLFLVPSFAIVLLLFVLT